ncbi:hypothetical protein VNO80_10974 [Phaseolus coccineus]|uniref:Uncharacterized protein n=1 Tax=Phaseolus coccineus TaxID=3886 RepID=A0AAN9N9N6_PHACN
MKKGEKIPIFSDLTFSLSPTSSHIHPYKYTASGSPSTSYRSHIPSCPSGSPNFYFSSEFPMCFSRVHRENMAESRYLCS